MTLDLLMYVGVFVGCLAIDFCYLRWQFAAGSGRIVSATCWTGLIVLLGSLTTLAFVQNWWCLVPSLLGHCCGTWLAMRWQPKQEDVADLRQRLEALESKMVVDD